MDSAALRSLTPILDGIDRWVELAPLLPVIISLELVLSADNAVALAAITRSLNDQKLQNQALNIGIFISLIFRIMLILFSQLILRYKSIQFTCGLYLLYLSVQNIFIKKNNINPIDRHLNENTENISIIKIILLLAVTDLAFSIDSITAAVSISDQLLLVITGASIGVIALRFTSSLFIRWLEIYTRLELAGYIAIGLVGLKLIVTLLLPRFVLPEYILFLIMSILFIWGFSVKKVNEYI